MTHTEIKITAELVRDLLRDQITLKQTFFAETRDNSTINLTFHFWSGEIVTYTLTRSGTTITGTAT
jgi:endoglucanase